MRWNSIDLFSYRNHFRRSMSREDSAVCTIVFKNIAILYFEVTIADYNGWRRSESSGGSWTVRVTCVKIYNYVSASGCIHIIYINTAVENYYREARRRHVSCCQWGGKSPPDHHPLPITTLLQGSRWILVYKTKVYWRITVITTLKRRRTRNWTVRVYTLIIRLISNAMALFRSCRLIVSIRVNLRINQIVLTGFPTIYDFARQFEQF